MRLRFKERKFGLHEPTVHPPVAVSHRRRRALSPLSLDAPSGALVVLKRIDRSSV